jgi:hypothetical protein
MKRIITILAILILVNFPSVISLTENINQFGGLPDYFNWRDINGIDYTTTIKDQSPAPTCEAYALVASLETLIQYQTELIFEPDLSEAHLYFYSGGTYEAGGVNVQDAANYLLENGVPDEGCFPDPHRPYDYPFESLPGWKNRSVKIQNWGWVEQNEYEIKNALIKYGPLIICIYIYEDFYQYREGIYKHTFGEKVGGHLVALIGYNDNEQCWIVKNSWGSRWGENGWFRMAYDQDIFIPKCYGGTGIMFIDGIYGNFIPDVPKIKIEQPKIYHTYLFDFEFPSLIRKISGMQTAAPRIVGRNTIKLNATNTNKVEFYLDGELKLTDNEPPYEWNLDTNSGLHTIETFAYNEKDMSKDIVDIFVLF